MNHDPIDRIGDGSVADADRPSLPTTQAEETTMSSTATAPGQMIAVNGVSLFVEDQGEGVPVVLGHGGFGSHSNWGAVVPMLARSCRVITFDTRGHGRSTNPNGELTYEIVADDIAGLINTMHLDRPVVGGWSDGGEFALQLGIRHPGVARALIAGGTSLEMGTEVARAAMREMFHIDAVGTVDMDGFTSGEWGQMLVPMMQHAHTQSSDHWQTVVRQSAKMWIDYNGITQGQLNMIQAPTLVVGGDRDQVIPVEELVRLYRALPTAELAILPGADHMRPVRDPACFIAAVSDFLTRI
jgi:pimeloyl-ACP methyl ester carboxylesterase